MNLMVVLVPFLLSGIVFSRLAVLEMKLPDSQKNPEIVQSEKEPFRLVVALRATGLTVSGSGITLTRFPFTRPGDPLEPLSRLLQKVKNSYPNEQAMILLSEPDIPYDSLIAVMDACRETQDQVLFPKISIGEVKAA